MNREDPTDISNVSLEGITERLQYQRAAEKGPGAPPKKGATGPAALPMPPKLSAKEATEQKELAESSRISSKKSVQRERVRGRTLRSPSGGIMHGRWHNALRGGVARHPEARAIRHARRIGLRDPRAVAHRRLPVLARAQVKVARVGVAAPVPCDTSVEQSRKRHCQCQPGAVLRRGANGRGAGAERVQRP